MRIPQKIDTYFDEHTRVTTNVCARILDRKLWAVATRYLSLGYKIVDFILKLYKYDINLLLVRKF